MYLLNNLKFDINAQHVIDDVQYPRVWFLDAENRAAVGVTEVPDPVWPDPELFTASENPDGTLTITPLAPEVIAARVASAEAQRVSMLWQAARDYEYQQISGSAIGLLSLGVMQQLPKCLAVQAWIKSIWTLYYERKAGTSMDTDFSVIGPCPHSVPELMTELGL